MYINTLHTHTHTYIYMSAEDTGSIPRSGRSPGVGTGNPLQYSFFFLKNFSFFTSVFLPGKFHGLEAGGLQSMGVANSQTGLST